VDALRKHGRVVYLHRPIDYLARRAENDRDRPALSDDETFPPDHEAPRSLVSRRAHT